MAISFQAYSVSGNPCSRITVPFGLGLRTIIRLNFMSESDFDESDFRCGVLRAEMLGAPGQHRNAKREDDRDQFLHG